MGAMAMGVLCEVLLRIADGARQMSYQWEVVAISRNVRRTTHSPARQAQG